MQLGTYNVCSLGQYIKDISYGASVDNCYTDSGIPFLRIKDLKPNEIYSQEIVFLPIELEKDVLTSRVSIDDVLITRSGTIGVCSVVDEAHDGFAFGSFMIKFSLVNIVPQYVSYIINSFIGKVYFERNKIGAIQGNITIPVIKSLQIPIPEIEKQIKIVESIDCIRQQAKKYSQEAQETHTYTIEITNGSISLVKWSVKTKEDRTLFVNKDTLKGPVKLKRYFNSKYNKKEITK